MPAPIYEAPLRHPILVQRSNLGRPLFLVIGPSEVRATSGATLVGHYFRYNLHEPTPLLKPHKGLSSGSEILHGLLSNTNIKIPIKKKSRGPPLPPAL